MFISKTESSFLQYSDPEAHLKSLINGFQKATTKDSDIADAFAVFQKHFKFSIIDKDGAKRLHDLKKRGVEKLGIQVGNLPIEMAAGLAVMYDSVIQAIRSSDKAITSKIFTGRSVDIAARLADFAIEKIGSSTVTALELAIDDPKYANHLRNLCDRLNWLALAPPGTGICEYCIIEVTDNMGNVSTQCPDKETCDALGTIVVVALIIWLVYSIVDWIW